MCLIAFRWQPDSDRPLILAANRDEFHERPTRAMAWWRWPDGPLAGFDEQAGGTWLAAERTGRFAAITNFRDPDAGRGARSRGELAVKWLNSGSSAATFADAVRARRSLYGPFTLVFGSCDEMWSVGTHAEPAAIEPGTHALSNHLLDTPWPKSIRAVRRLEDWIAREEAGIDGLLDLLDDTEPAAAGELPDTGVGESLESMLSAPFIVSERYGTRSSSALLLSDTVTMAERTFDPAGEPYGERVFTWRRGGAA
ncbi:MAG: NRDE family protein [Candidatus Wenzhouxiangella sp. M2_3B_020]